jgi:Yip1 domain.
MSLLARLLNVFAIPGAVFQDIRESARHQPGSWIIPILLATIVSSFTFGTILSQPGILNELKSKQTAVVNEQLAAGKIEQAEAEKSIRIIEQLSRPEIIHPLVGIGFFVISVLRVAWWSFVLCLLARLFLKERLNWLKAIEAAGLASMISILGNIVFAILAFSIQTGSATGITDTLQQLELRNKSWPVILASNGFNIWFVFLLATALARLMNVPLFRTLFLMMGTWLALQLGFGLLVAGFGFVK